MQLQKRPGCSRPQTDHRVMPFQGICGKDPKDHIREGPCERWHTEDMIIPIMLISVRWLNGRYRGGQRGAVVAGTLV